MAAKHRSQGKVKKQKAEAVSLQNNYRIPIIVCATIVVGLLSIYVFQYEKMKLECFASQKETLHNKSQDIPCSEDYAEELDKYPRCAPRKCGRFISDEIVTLDEVEVLLHLAKHGISLGGSSGGASILDLHSGALSKDDAFVNVYKLGSDVITKENLAIYSSVKNKIKEAIVTHFDLESSELFLTHPTFFSRITSIPARTIHDEYWHPHVDKETYGSFHYTSLLYLTDYMNDFSGGRFFFIDKQLNITVEPKSGRLSAFTSGSENRHFVEKVEEGTRYAITVSFTCNPDESIVDPSIP